MKKNNASATFLTYLITDGTTSDLNFKTKKSAVLKLIETAVQTKISLIQIREKNLAARFVFEIALEAAKIAGQSETKILINDRADIALAAGADGVHLTSNSISADVIRQAFPKNFIVGASAHTLEAAEKARANGADFVAFSPIFHSPGKGAAQGIEMLKTICERLNPFPVIALGGIDETNWRDVLQTGASGFAAIRFLNDAENLKKIRRDFSNFRRTENDK